MDLVPDKSHTYIRGMLQKTVVVGAGPVGALAALYAAHRGDLVEVYDLRADLRDPTSIPLNFTKSINLALSERGISAIREARCPGLASSIIKNTVPMYGRMIHGRDGMKFTENSQAYDIHGRAIRAIDRNGLNKTLLDELEQMPNVRLKFGHKLTGADFKQNVAWFEKQDSDRTGGRRAEEIEVKFDFMIGADGAFSATRFHLMKFARVSYQQEFIDTLWCEFVIPSKSNGEAPISQNHLHIWPAGEFMFIALPNLDKSFNCTLFMPASIFDRMDASKSLLVPFFEQHFPGVVPDLISIDQLINQYTSNPHLPLISIKCDPYHYGSSVVIVGDAAHAMVPFYGQGMNAGMEDVRVLFETIDKHVPPMSKARHSFTAEGRTFSRALALDEYSWQRRRDAHAINDFSMGNYAEMRSDVMSCSYLLRKRVEEWLTVHVPVLGFATKYSRISFSNERYSSVKQSVAWQHEVLNGAGIVLATAAALLAMSRIIKWKNG